MFLFCCCCSFRCCCFDVFYERTNINKTVRFFLSAFIRLKLTARKTVEWYTSQRDCAAYPIFNHSFAWMDKNRLFDSSLSLSHSVSLFSRKRSVRVESLNDWCLFRVQHWKQFLSIFERWWTRSKIVSGIGQWFLWFAVNWITEFLRFSFLLRK